MAYTIDLQGKVAIITGSAKGIGLATAKLLAQAGANVVVNDIASPDKVSAQLNEIAALGPQPLYLQKDISDQASVEALVTETVDHFGSVDILVNNAGLVADWQKSFDVHVKGLYYCSEAVVPVMKQQGGGRIINLTSTCVQTGGTGIPEYVATKAGAYSLTRYFAKTYAPFGILTNAVMPSVIMSDMIMTRYASEEEMIEHYTPQMPIRRIGYSEDIARVILFLCSDLSSYINGEIIVADGGRMYVG
jgi:NAD(P)-dependent dehydrogenase (short-subunit alcohol dehydrogenase family)